MSLCRRIIPTLLMRGNNLVKGEQFNSWRNVGPVIQAMKIFESRQVDELILLDIGATPEGRGPNIEMVRHVAAECFTPLTVGGGVRSLYDIDDLLRAGADKVSICTAAFESPSLICDAAKKFGSQCIVVSIDVSDNKVITHCGSRLRESAPQRWALEAEREGAGEILLNSVDRDGTLCGYNLNLIKSMAKLVNIPVIASGGARDYQDFYAAFQAEADAVAAGAMFQFTDATPLEAKHHLADNNIEVRL